ncbi:MAG: fibronectin type III domain-containing protein [Bacteroidia bacterium]
MTTTSAQLNWNSTGATSYNIQYRVNGTSTWTLASSFSGPSISINSLASGTQYDFQVQSNCNGTLSSWSSVANFTTTTVIPTCNTPTGLTAINITFNSAQLNWNSTGAVSYKIQYKINGSSSWTLVTSNSTSITINSLTPVTQYIFQLQSACSGGLLSSWSSGSNFTTLASCGEPTLLNTDSISTNAATVNWNSTGATSYELRYRKVNEINWIYNTTSATSFHITGLDTNTSYEYQISSICNGSNSAYSIIQNFTTLELCDNPVSISLISSSQSTLTLQWIPTGAANYELRFRPEGTSVWYFAIATSELITLTGLVPQTPYDVQVRSLCNSNNSNYSTLQSYQTTPLCVDPSAVNITLQSNGRVIVSWMSSNSIYYEFRYRISGTTNWNSATVSINQVELSNLNPATNYDFEVRSICNAIDTSGYSQTVTFNSTVVSSNSLENISTSVYPNPVKNLLFIETDIPDAFDVSIFNLMGAKVNQIRINPTSGKARVDMSGLAPGTYLLKISSGKLNSIRKIVKTNS